MNCRWGGRNVDRCKNTAVAVIVVASGRRTARCIRHVEPTAWRLTPDEERAYFARRTGTTREGP